MLQGQAVAVGEIIALDHEGQHLVFHVSAASPFLGAGADTADDAVRAYVSGWETRIRIEAAPAVQGGEADRPQASAAAGNTQRATTSMVGGLQRQLAMLREVVALPLQRPDLFRQFGIKPPRGVLLVGPPGTGKTLVARALAAECDARVLTISGAEVVSKYYGETEARLQAIFREAHRCAPAIILMDEVDALCPSRDASTSELEKRIVATLLTLLDGATLPGEDVPGNGPANASAARAHVMVVATTNRPDALDPAMRRPGRFDQEVEIPIPNEPERRDILRVLLQHVPHSCSEADIDYVSQRAHGYVGADLAAVCKEAGLLALKRVYTAQAGAARTEEVPPLAAGSAASAAVLGGTAPQRAEPATGAELLDRIVVTADDLRGGLQEVRPSAMREITIDVPRVLWSDVGGQEETKRRLKEAVEWPLRHPEAFERMGIRPPRGVLLYGPPGCSKTLMAKALATETQLNFIAVKGPELFSKWVGESERAVQTVFRKARSAAPSIVFFDEIDALAVQRGSSGEGSSVADRVLSQLLSEMDGVQALGSVTVIAATNRPDLMDGALLRPGRFDRQIYVRPPDTPTREQIFTICLRGMPHDEDVHPATLAGQTDGFSGAEIAAVCREAALAAMASDPANASSIGLAAFQKAIAGVTPNITKEMLAFYDGYERRAA